MKQRWERREKKVRRRKKQMPVHGYGLRIPTQVTGKKKKPKKK
jgi:hypothetical protein